jgi:hypothetical protein
MAHRQMNRLFRFLRWGPYEDAAGWLRGLVITLSAAVFMSVVGAFGSARMSMVPRIAYWLGLMLVGWIWGAFVSRYFFRVLRWPRQTWLRIAMASLALSIPYSVVVGYASVLAFGSISSWRTSPSWSARSRPSPWRWSRSMCWWIAKA